MKIDVVFLVKYSTKKQGLYIFQNPGGELHTTFKPLNLPPISPIFAIVSSLLNFHLWAVIKINCNEKNSNHFNHVFKL